MKKKIIIIIAAAVAATALLITGTILMLRSAFNESGNSSEKDPSTQITVGSITGSKGEIVKIPVKIDNNPGFMACLLKFEYNNDILQYIGYQKGDILSDSDIVDNDGNLTFLSMETNDVKEDGNLLYLEFEILSDNAQSTPITLNLKDSSISNYNEELITAKALNGTITIK